MFTYGKSKSSRDGSDSQGRSRRDMAGTSHDSNDMVSRRGPTTGAISDISNFDKKWNPYVEKEARTGYRSWTDGEFIGDEDIKRSYADVTRSKLNPYAKEFIPKLTSVLETEVKLVEEKVNLVEKLASNLSNPSKIVGSSQHKLKFKRVKSKSKVSLPPLDSNDSNKHKHLDSELDHRTWIFGTKNIDLEEFIYVHFTAVVHL